ncbi:MAG: PilN domain-containing protein [Anaerohalosphaeraceae bacterium]
MNEIDFIPQWYKAGRERKQRYIRQYALMATLFTLMLGWGFVINGHVSHVKAEVQEIETAFEKGRARSEQATDLQTRIAEMKDKKGLLDKIESRTQMTAILGEISYLIGKNVILSRLSLQNELIGDPGKKNAFASGAVVQVSGSQQDDQDDVVPASPSHYKVVLTGIAARPADAALLIARLEDTDYFDGVFLVYSKPKKVKDEDVTEFEIRCFVADYQRLN